MKNAQIKFNFLSNSRIELIKWIFLLCLFTYIVNFYIFEVIVSDRNLKMVGSFLQISISVVISLAFVKYTYNRNQELQFNAALTNLIQEMVTNLGRLSPSFISSELNELPKRRDAGDWIGFKKMESFTNNSGGNNFYLKYVPDTHYYNFTSKGFFASEYANVIDGDLRYLIAKFYHKCDLISTNIQKLENNINKLGILPDNYRDYYVNIIETTFSIYYTKDFYKESYETIKLIVNKYPDLEKVVNILNLNEKLNLQGD